MAAPTEKSILRRVGTRSFERGERYFRGGHVHDGRRQGDLLKARCHGSDDNDYRIEVRLHGARIIAGRCTCPVGDDGMCKHVAALLLNWREQPEDFQESPPLDAVLARCSRSDLILVIRMLLDAQPDLEGVIEAVLPVPDQTPAQTLEAVQQTVIRVLKRLADGGAPAAVVATIDGQRQQAETRCAAGDIQTASVVCRGIIAGVLERYDVHADATEDVARAVSDAAGLLTRCFAMLPEDDSQRREILHDLLTLLCFDVCSAGVGLAESVPDGIARNLTAAERRHVIEWARDAAPPATRNGTVDAWQRECWGALIADLVGDDLDDAAYLEHCREFGLGAALVARLLQLNDLDAARDVAARLDEPHLPEIAELFVKHGRDADAITLLQCRAADSPAAAAWLTDYYDNRGLWSGALEWRRHEFEQQPDLVNYRAVRRAAQKAGRWPALQDELFEIVGRIADPDERLRILLEERRIDDLLRELERAARSGQTPCDGLLEDVARRIEKTHSEQAIDLYLQIAERLIEGRRSGNDAAAADLLTRARDLYAAAGRQQDWNRCIADIATRHSRRRTLQQQLRRAKLLT